jgi:hypothetical protein
MSLYGEGVLSGCREARGPPLSVLRGTAWKRCYSYREASTSPFGSSPALLPPPPIPPRHGARAPPAALGRRGRGQPVPSAAVVAARRGRGGAAPPPLSPNRVTGGAARVCLRAHKCAPNSQDRSRPPSYSGCPCPAGSRPQAIPPGGARLRPIPAAPARAPHSPPGRPGGCTRRGGRRPLRACSGSARGGVPPTPTPTHKRWVWLSRSCYPETEGRKTAPAARPSRRGAATAGNKGDKAASARPGSAPTPASPAGPPSPRADQAGSSREERDARPRTARDPAFRPRELRFYLGRGMRGESTPRARRGAGRVLHSGGSYGNVAGADA